MIKLNIGSNNVLLDDWVNMDILDIPGVIKYDARGTIPYDDNSVDFIFSEHFIEHLNESEANYFFSECYRVLRPDSVMRTATFNINDIMKICLDWDKHKNSYSNGIFKDKGAIDFFNLAVYEGNLHHYMYDHKEMIRIIKRAGFTKFNTPLRGSSSYLDLKNLEWRENSTCIVEAIK